MNLNPNHQKKYRVRLDIIDEKIQQLYKIYGDLNSSIRTLTEQRAIINDECFVSNIDSEFKYDSNLYSILCFMHSWKKSKNNQPSTEEKAKVLESLNNLIDDRKKWLEPFSGRCIFFNYKFQD